MVKVCVKKLKRQTFDYGRSNFNEYTVKQISVVFTSVTLNLKIKHSGCTFQNMRFHCCQIIINIKNICICFCCRSENWFMLFKSPYRLVTIQFTTTSFQQELGTYTDAKGMKNLDHELNSVCRFSTLS
jgi:hypothetical protein